MTEDQMEDHLAFWYAYDADYGPDPSYELGAREMIKKIKAKAVRDALSELAERFDRAGDVADAADYKAWEFDAAEEVREFRDK